MIVDGYEARDPMVFRVEDRWILYYTATSEPSGGAFVVAAAESDDLVHWHGRHVVYRDEMSGTGGGPTESPFVFLHDGRYHLAIGPDWEGLMRSHSETGRYDRAAYRRTRVLASDDPLHFSLDDLVAVVDAHAAEVIVDEQTRLVDEPLWLGSRWCLPGAAHLVLMRARLSAWPLSKTSSPWPAPTASSRWCRRSATTPRSRPRWSTQA